MSIFTKLGNDIAAGTDASGASRQVVNSEMQVWLTEAEKIIDAAVSAGNFLLYTTKALLDADLVPAANTAALVLGESATNDGIYVKSGATGTGSWAKVSEPPSSGFLQATDAAGSANAIAVTTTATANESHLFVVPIVITNTAAPVTISFNGDTAKTIKGLDGLDVSVGELTAGSSIFGFISGTEFKWTIAANGATGLQGIQGIQGVKGNSTGLAYTFSTSTTAADPGTGGLRFNNATLANVTEIYINDADADGGDPSAYIDTWDDSTSTVKSRLLIRSTDDVSKLGIFNVALVVNSTGYRTLTVVYVGGTAALIASENLVLENNGGNGPKGDTGPAGSGLANIVDDITPQLGGNLDANGKTIDGRDVATDGTKLDAIEAAADVTDATNVAAAGALMLAETTTAQYLANTANKALSTDQVWAAGFEVALTDAATIAVDMSLFINATVTLGGNRALGNPTNAKPGQSGRFRFVQDVTGSRTLSAGSSFVFDDSITPALPTPANSESLWYYDVITATKIYISTSGKAVG